MDSILDVRSLEKTYDNGVTALKNISFSVQRGEFLAIIGLSGSGKSTLLRCLNRLVDPSSGSVLLNGQDLTKLDRKALRSARSRIGMIFQHFNLVKRRSVLSNVLSGRLAHTSTLRSLLGRFSEEDVARANEYLKLVGLEEKAPNRADELSGGQQQRVAIARVLMQDPEIILADEPVASLDPATSHSVMRYLQKAQKELGKTIICNLHFLSLVREFSTRVIALKHGEIIFQGDSKDITNEWFINIYGKDAVEVEIR